MLFAKKSFDAGVMFGFHIFLSDPGKPGSDLWVRMSVRQTPCADLTDVTLTDEDTNAILTDNVNSYPT